MKGKQFRFIFISLFLLLLILFWLDVFLGSVSIPLSESLRILTGSSDSQSWNYILLHMRLPKALTAIMAGAGLSVAGLMMQTLFRNPLAGPYVLGISSGATLGVAVFVMASAVINLGVAGNILHGYGQVFAAIAGASLVFVLILLVASHIRDAVSLLIVGIMFGSLTTAVVSILQYFSKPELVQQFVIWTLGSLSSTGWEQLRIATFFLIPGLVLSVILIKPMNVLLLGESHAGTTGVNMKRIRLGLLIASSLIAGALTAFTGPIAFIGIAVPHITRLALGTTNHRYMVPGVILVGSCIMLVCDLISQLPGNTLVLPVNAITALFGAPVVLWIVLGKRKLKSGF